MSRSTEPHKPSRMVASGGDPWISVSLLAEHTFCPRAGIIQCESAEEDRGEEVFHLGRGMRRVFYDFNQLRRVLRRTLIFNLCIFAWIVVSIGVGIVLEEEIRGAATLLGCFFSLNLFSFSLALIVGVLRWLYVYFFRYLPAKLTRASAPSPYHTESCLVNWWGLINAGFHPIRPQDYYRDVQWRLTGCPWRVLVKGDLRIPVFRKRPNRGTAGEKLFRQHYARMAAYCHLLEKCENAKSPYGIVIFGDSHTGITVPSQPGSKKTFHDGLINARRTIANVNRFLPQYPANPQICVLCPHSRRDRMTGASVCGSRFGWVPPNYRDAYDY